MQYKTSFFFTFAGQFLVAFATFLSIQFLFMRFDSVGGFSQNEILICFAVMVTAFSLGELFGRGFDTFPRILGNGNFDRILVRPRNVILLVLASNAEFSRLGRFLQAILIFVYVLPQSGIAWTWDKIIVLTLMIICGSLLFFGLFVIYASFSFFTLEGLEFVNILTDGSREHGRFPFSIYGESVLRFLTYVVPIALIQYYPLLYILGRETGIFYALSPVISLLFLLPCYGFFRFGLRKYKSTGS